MSAKCARKLRFLLCTVTWLRWTVLYQLSEDGSSILLKSPEKTLSLEDRAPSPAAAQTEDGRDPWRMTRCMADRRSLANLSSDFLLTLLPLRGLWWNQIKTSRESIKKPSPNAFCFECLVAVSPPIPWVHDCPPACACPSCTKQQAILSSSNLGSSSRSHVPAVCRLIWGFCKHFDFNVILQRALLLQDVFFFLIDFYLRAVFTLKQPCLLAPTAQEYICKWPALNIVVC